VESRREKNNKSWKLRKKSNRRYHLKKNYNMTLDDEAFILSYQDNKCAICKTKLVSAYVDHDHKTDDIRGILCINCNSGLGQFKDSIKNLEAAIEYLKRPIVFTNVITQALKISVGE